MEGKDILDEIYNLFQAKMPCSTDDIEISQAKKILGTVMVDKDNENAISDYGIECERSGFRYGFILAVRIMSQCINGITDSTL
jgi:hypothetical protein